ncbi:MAG: type VI secretion system baseplate subunit TssF [Phycisphaerales bacterium]|nr:MAG: type VI secretion system baseplate subunit TssF [Phycisphaerales bacterium]
MDKRLLRLYERELRHLRESAAEFASEYPKIAGRLGLGDLECSDPYVERLLEGFAYLAARVQLKLDAHFPRITQHLLESVYPHYLAPTPSMCVVRYEPDLNEAALAGGFLVPRGTPMRSILGRGDRTPCEYRSAHDVRLLPIRLEEASYHTRDVGSLDLPPELSGRNAPKAALRLKFRATASLTFAEIDLDRLDLYLLGTDQTPTRLYEQIYAHRTGVLVRPAQKPPEFTEVLPASSIRQLGFDDAEALLPVTARSFQGYRLLQEYFTFPQRFSFVRLSGLREAAKRCSGTELEVIVLLDADDPELDGAVEPDNFALFCTPAINLFPRRTDRIHIDEYRHEFHVVPDRTRPADFEVHQVLSVEGYGSGGAQAIEFKPFYAASEFDEGGGAFFSTNRRPRTLTGQERRTGRKTSYTGSEVFVALVDATNAPFRSDLRQLGVETLCTNRHLPLRMPLGTGRTDFTAETGPAVRSIRVITGPTSPRPSFAEGETAWRLISHLSLNYLSLVDEDQARGATALRDLLKLYGDATSPVMRKQVEGARSISAKPITRRVKTPGPISFARGLEVTLTLEDASFEGTGIFVLGAVMERFFAKYVSINSFTETVVRSAERGQVIRWPARTGQRAIL